MYARGVLTNSKIQPYLCEANAEHNCTVFLIPFIEEKRQVMKVSVNAAIFVDRLNSGESQIDCLEDVSNLKDKLTISKFVENSLKKTPKTTNSKQSKHCVKRTVGDCIIQFLNNFSLMDMSITV